MKNHHINDKQLRYLEFINREKSFRHHHYNEEMLQYEYLKEGNLSAIDESIKMFSSPTLGKLSDDTLRHWKYMFVASTTLATRFAIEGGMEEETAYNASDLYIQKADQCQSVEQIKILQTEMFTYFTKQVMSSKKTHIYSKQIVLCIDYIYNHLHESIHVVDLASYVNLNPSYLSTLFKSEVGISISEYIINKRIETAQNMLKFSEYSYAEISSYLAFSSQSYFTKQFKKHTGFTPKEYRNRFFRTSFSEK